MSPNEFPEQNAPLKSWIGIALGPTEAEITSESVSAFSSAIAAPLESGVPATYLTCFRELESKFLHQLQIPLEKVLHAEQEYTYDEPLEVGMQIRYQTRLANVLEKRGSAGSLAFMVFETEFENAKNPSSAKKRIALSKTTIVVRRA